MNTSRTLKNLAVWGVLVTASGCASVPEEFLTSMEKEREGIALLKERHFQAVTELADNWYAERLKLMQVIRNRELEKASFPAESPDGSGSIDAVPTEKIIEIEEQFNEAVETARQIRNKLIEGYADRDNWRKLRRLNEINLEMVRSLTELNQAQRKFYGELVNAISISPEEFISDKLLDQLDKQ